MTRKFSRLIFILVILCVFAPLPTDAIAAAPVTQEEIEAILEKENIKVLSTSTLPESLKRKINQVGNSSSFGRIPQAIEGAASSAKKIIAPSLEKLNPTSTEIKKVLNEIRDQADSSILNAVYERFISILKSVWLAIVNWLNTAAKK